METGKSSEDLIREARAWSEAPGTSPAAQEPPRPSRSDPPTMAPRDPFPTGVPAPARPPAPPAPVPPPPRAGGGGGLRFAVLVALIGVGLAALFGWRAVTGSDEVEIFSVTPGTCFLEPEAVTVSYVDVVDCSASHDLEALAVVTLPYSPDAAMPTNEELFGTAWEQCLPFFTPYTGEPYETSRWWLDAFVPDHRGWKLGDREALCVVFLATADGTLLPAVESARA